MKDIEKYESNGSTDSAAIMQLGTAIGALMMLKKLEPALSDGTRNGSSLCASQLQQLPQVKQQLTAVVEDSLNTIGITLNIPTPTDNIIQSTIEGK